MAWNNTWKKKLYTPGQKESFALSRSKIDLFLQCPRCFYLDRVQGLARPQFPAFLLNSAVDELFKKEFDTYRASRKPHPVMEQYGIQVLPFQHPNLDVWRHNFTGVRTLHTPTQFEIFGAVDDLWVNNAGELFVVDYKSTSKEETITLDDKWKEGYKRQLEVYQWLLRQNNFTVSDIGYFVFANGLKNKPMFNNKLEFETTLLSYEGDTSWIEDTLFRIKETLDTTELPAPCDECEYCTYAQKRKEYNSI
jgi:RecB family exonuclease